MRTETVICDTRDFRIGRRLNQENWRALRAVGEEANKRLCDAQASDAKPAPDVVTFEEVTRPSKTKDGLHAPGLRFGNPRVMALFSAVVGFTHTVVGFTNAQLVELVNPLLDGIAYTGRQATYDLRRLIRKEVIVRIPHTRRYQFTPCGRRAAVLFTKTYGRVLTPALASLDPTLPLEIARRSPLAMTWRDFERALQEFIDAQMLGAPLPEASAQRSGRARSGATHAKRTKPLRSSAA